MNKETKIFMWIWNCVVLGGAMSIMFNGYWWGVLLLLALAYNEKGE